MLEAMCILCFDRLHGIGRDQNFLLKIEEEWDDKIHPIISSNVWSTNLLRGLVEKRNAITWTKMNC